MFKLALLMSAILFQISSWNEMGHFIIARIAEQRLSKGNSKGLHKIYDILESLRTYFPERKNSLLEASIVPDLMVNQFHEFLMYFHFINVPIPYKNDKASNLRYADPFLFNVTYAYDTSVKIVKDSIKSSERIETNQKSIKNGLMDSIMLRYLLHIVGDVHQPLHTTALYSNKLYDGALEHGDMGGNLIPVTYMPDKNIANLHYLWDTAVGSYTQKFTFPLDTKSIELIDKCVDDIVNEYPETYFGDKVYSLNIDNWVEESKYLADSFVYSDIDIFPTLRAQYLAEGRKISRMRIALAGYRLYYVLVDLFVDLVKDKGN